jgi:hypothetical protein
MSDDDFPPPLSPEEAAELRRRRRGRNIALLVVLVAVCALFYAIAMVKMGEMGRQHPQLHRDAPATAPRQTGSSSGLEHAPEMAMMRHVFLVGSA